MMWYKNKNISYQNPKNKKKKKKKNPSIRKKEKNRKKERKRRSLKLGECCIHFIVICVQF